MHTTIHAFLETAWTDHGDHPGEVAERLATSIGLVRAHADFAPYVRLLTHVYGEHLGQWQAAIELLGRLRALPSSDGSPEVAQLIERAVATMRFAAGDGAALDGLSFDDRVSALATAASAFAARAEFPRAIAALQYALESAERGLPAGSPAIRALAIGGNNLAALLESRPNRDAMQTQAMLAAAEAGLKYWKLAGTWLEEERAEYRLARSQLQAGKARDAVASAQRCIAVCRMNGASAFEQFFGFAVLALAQRSAGDRVASDASRAEAMRQLELVSDDERQWCSADLAELGAMM
jgi:tetratricopeptide (TPR) repeat protein